MKSSFVFEVLTQTYRILCTESKISVISKRLESLHTERLSDTEAVFAESKVVSGFFQKPRHELFVIYISPGESYFHIKHVA